MDFLPFKGFHKRIKGKMLGAKSFFRFIFLYWLLWFYNNDYIHYFYIRSETPSKNWNATNSSPTSRHTWDSPPSIMAGPTYHPPSLFLNHKTFINWIIIYRYLANRMPNAWLFYCCCPSYQIGGREENQLWIFIVLQSLAGWGVRSDVLMPPHLAFIHF